MKKIILIVLTIASVQLFSNDIGLTAKQHNISDQRAEQIKKAKKEIEELRAKGELLYVKANNNAKQYKKADKSLDYTPGPMPGNMELLFTFYPVIVVLLIGYFLFIKKIRIM